MRRAFIVAAVLLVGLAALSRWLPRGTREGTLPRVVLWAWERTEHLEFIDPREVAVAYLAGTVHLRGGGIDVLPRLQPLGVPANTRLLAVVRVEPAPGSAPELTPEQRGQTASAILRLADLPGIAGTQVDFDARVGERGFYAALLRDLRRRLPEDRLLSITALASWCLDDNWIAGLPIDEAVPMLFRMGQDDGEVRRRLRRGQDFTDRTCRSSVGVSTDEPLPPLARGRRVYIFHPKSWTRAAAINAQREVSLWQ